MVQGTRGLQRSHAQDPDIRLIRNPRLNEDYGRADLQTPLIEFILSIFPLPSIFSPALLCFDLL